MLISVFTNTFYNIKLWTLVNAPSTDIKDYEMLKTILLPINSF